MREQLFGSITAKKNYHGVQSPKNFGTVYIYKWDVRLTALTSNQKLVYLHISLRLVTNKRMSIKIIAHVAVFCYGHISVH